MRFSIIVPIYNVERYLQNCLDSIINQTYKDFELILIDDGSTDGSGAICDKYANRHSYIKVVHKKNEGLAATWMKDGLDLAQGDYCGSIDSDDWVDSDLLERISQQIDNTHPDIVVYGYKNVYDNGEQINRITARNGYYDKEAIENEILPRLINEGGFQNRNCIFLSRVNKFIKKELLLNNRLHYNPRISFGEDNFWTIPNVLSAGSLYVFSDWYPYSYRVNPASISRSYNEGLWEKFNKLAQAEIDILKHFEKEWMCEQVYNDMVFHAAISINNVMRGGKTGNDAIKEIMLIINNPGVQQGLRGIKNNMCSFRERINIKLMKMKAATIIYYAKRFQYSMKRK